MFRLLAGAARVVGSVVAGGAAAGLSAAVEFEEGLQPAPGTIAATTQAVTSDKDATLRSAPAWPAAR